MIILKGVLFGIGLAAFGTFAYILFLMWPLFQPGAGFDVTSLKHSTYLAWPYWVFVLGLILTGIGIVALWPRPVV